MSRSPCSSEESAVFDSLLYRIHSTTERESEWNDVLGLLRDWMGGRSASLARHHFPSGQGGALYSAPEDADFRTAFAEYASRNPWFLSSVEYAPGRVMTGEEMLSNRDLLKTDFYRGLLKPRGLLHGLCGVAARRGDLVYYVVVHRGDEQQSFGERERSHMQAVLSHISLALENRWRYQEANDLSTAMKGVVDQYSHATFLVDQERRVLYRNRTAALCAQGDTGLRLEGEHLAGATPTDSKALREAIRDVTRMAVQNVAEASRVVTVSALDGDLPKVLIVRAVGTVFSAEAGEHRHLVTLTLGNPHAGHDSQNCPFARQFELTPAQARVSALVFSGHSLATVGRMLHVSDNTVRSHLKQIFQKTNTHGQMELVHLHARVCVDRI